MNLRDLAYLVAVADHRHFGRAAQACFVSQPTLSTQLKKLEAELGALLLERNSRQVMLTGVGEQVVASARRILADIEDIRTATRRSADPRTGVLRIGAFPTIAPYLLPHVLPAIRARLPQLELRLVEEKSAVLSEMLRSGRLDAAVLALPVAEEGLHVERLFREDFVLAAPAGHALARAGVPASAAELSGERVLLLTEGHCLRDQALAVCQLAGAGERDGLQATSLETLRLMVAAGVGITLLPRLSVSPPVPSSPDVTLREFVAPAPHRDIALLWRRSSPLSEVLSEVAAAMRELPTDLVTPLPPG